MPPATKNKFEELLKRYQALLQALERTLSARKTLQREAIQEDFQQLLRNASEKRALPSASEADFGRGSPYIPLRRELTRFLSEKDFPAHEIMPIATPFLNATVTMEDPRDEDDTMETEGGAEEALVVRIGSLSLRAEIQFLRSMLDKMISLVSTDEEASAQCHPRRGQDQQVQVLLEGPLPLHYSAHSFLAPLAPEGTQPPILSDIRETTITTFTVDITKLKHAMEQQRSLNFCKKWLEQQGYTVRTGQKDCRELFIRETAVRGGNDRETQETRGITLEAARHLETLSGIVVFLDTIQVTADNSTMRSQLELYYTETKLIGADGKPKQFILNAAGKKTSQSNISLRQAATLWLHFQRLAMLGQRCGVGIAALNNESIVVGLQQSIRARQLTALKTMSTSSRSQAFSHESERGYLAIEAKLAAPTALTSRTSGASATLFTAAAGAGLAGGPGLSELEFEKQLEEFINSTFVIGPAALLKSTASTFSAGVKAIQGDERASSSLIKATQSSTTAASTGGRRPIEDYFLLLAQEIDASSSRTASVYERLLPERAAPVLSADDVLELKTSAYGRLVSNLEEIRIFFKEHSPYYFVKVLAQRLNLLMESRDLSEESIAHILTLFGVSPGELERYKLKDLGVFNRFHIQFDALSLALLAAQEHKILFNLRQMRIQMHPWIHDPQHHSYASNPDNFFTALEWKICLRFKLGWGVTQRSVDRSLTSHRDESTSGRSTHTAGSGAGPAVFGRTGASQPVGGNQEQKTVTPSKSD